MVFGTAKDETIVSIFRLPGGKSTGLAAVQTLAPPPAGANGKSWHGTIAASGWRCAPATHFPEPAVSEPSSAVPPTEPPDYDAFLRAHVLSQPLSIQRYDREDETIWVKRAGASNPAWRYRALALEVDEGLLWFWIGSHADYDAMIG